MDGKILRTLCAKLTYFTILHTFKMSLTVSTVKNMGLAKQETCWWRKTGLTTYKRWHTGTDTTYTSTTTGWNQWTDLQTDGWLTADYKQDYR